MYTPLGSRFSQYKKASRRNILYLHVAALAAAWSISVLCPFWAWRLPGLVPSLRMRSFHKVQSKRHDIRANMTAHVYSGAYNVLGYHTDHTSIDASLQQSWEHRICMCMLVVQTIGLLWIHLVVESPKNAQAHVQGRDKTL
jgi:hypothetical protein